MEYHKILKTHTFKCKMTLGAYIQKHGHFLQKLLQKFH